MNNPMYYVQVINHHQVKDLNQVLITMQVILAMDRTNGKPSVFGDRLYAKTWLDMPGSHLTYDHLLVGGKFFIPHGARIIKGA